jgi:hypothetical protein
MLPNAGLLLASQIQGNGLFEVPSWMAFHCVKANQSYYDAIAISFISVWLVFAFFNRIVNICYSQDRPERSWLFEFFVKRFKLKPDGARIDWPTAQERFNERFIKLPERRTSVRALSLSGALLLFFLEDIMGSFFWEILWVLFSLAYGLTGLFTIWGTCTQPGHDDDYGSCWPDILEMGLGQMMPLLLLILPVFAYIESYSESILPYRSDVF